METLLDGRTCLVFSTPEPCTVYINNYLHCTNNNIFVWIVNQTRQHPVRKYFAVLYKSDRSAKPINILLF